MSNIHHLESSAGSQARLLENWITEITSQHPDKDVAKRWTELARITARKFPAPPAPSQSNIDLDNLSVLSTLEKERVISEVQQFVASYMGDVRVQLMDIHREILTLQKSVAELESRAQVAPNDDA